MERAIGGPSDSELRNILAKLAQAKKDAAAAHQAQQNMSPGAGRDLQGKRTANNQDQLGQLYDEARKNGLVDGSNALTTKARQLLGM